MVVFGVFGRLTHYDYGFRIYNPSIGKFLSVDPLTKSYPWYTPYQFAGNKPIAVVDLDGLEEIHYKVIIDRNEGTATIKYSHSKDLIDFVSDGVNVNGGGIMSQKYKKVVNARQSVVFDIYDPSYGYNREGNKLTTNDKANKLKDYVDELNLSEKPNNPGSGYAAAYGMFDAYDRSAISKGEFELSDADKDQLDSEFALNTLSFIPISRLFSTTNWVKVGRWMSPTELEAMKNSGKLQVGSGEQTRIILEGAKNMDSYSAAPKGDLFVEFSIPASTHIGNAGKTGLWGMIYSSNSIFAKMLAKKGVKLEMPIVKDIKVIK